MQSADVQRKITVVQRYLLLPVDAAAAPCRIRLSVGGKPIHSFDVSLATDQPEWWAFLDLSDSAGHTVEIEATGAGANAPGLHALVMADDIRNLHPLYDEALRPQLRFSQKRGWINDPNGMVYCDGEYHLFYQHNPCGRMWANMYWGHAVSRDLLHWDELQPALRPWVHAKGMAFSGSAVVDVGNTAGFQSGAEPALIVVFTDTEAGESLAYSHDHGRTWTPYAGNPVLRHKGRDPKVIRWTPDGRTAEGHWVMAVFDEDATLGNTIAFHTSTDLKAWVFQGRLPGFYECPELFDAPVLDCGGRPTGERKWVLFAGDGQYVIGHFDGRMFRPEHEGKHRLHYGNYYASQLFNHAPGDRRIQIGWARNLATPGMPFNQVFTFPAELTLRQTHAGVRLFAEPIREIETLRVRSRTLAPATLADGETLRLPVSGQLLDIDIRFELGTAARFGMRLGQTLVGYDTHRRMLGEMPLEPEGGCVTIRVLLDRPMVEVIGNRGRVYGTFPRPDGGVAADVALFSEGGAARVTEGAAHELRSIWK